MGVFLNAHGIKLYNMKKYIYFIFPLIALGITLVALFIYFSKAQAGGKSDFIDSIQQGNNNPAVIPEVNAPGNCIKKVNCGINDSCRKCCCCKSGFKHETGENGEVPVGINPHLYNADTSELNVPPPVEVK